LLLWQQQQPQFYGHYTGQPALAGTSNKELEDFVGAMHKCWLFQFRNTAAMLGIYNLSKLSTIFAASCSLPSVVLCRVSIWSRSSSSTRLRRINDWISFSA